MPAVIISGAPGSGKTTLARRLGDAVGLPVLSKDLFKEALFDALGVGDLDWSRRLGQASYAILFAAAASVMRAGTSVIVESNFHRGLSEKALAALVEAQPACIVHCECATDVAVRRYAERALSPERHPGHLDARMVPVIRAQLEAGTLEPCELGLPLLRVDTSDGYRPGFEHIVAFTRQATAA
ncbi:AAA family ATPase [soil metagenome]